MIEQSVSLASNGVVKVPGYEQLVRFGYTKNKGVYHLHVDATGEWEGLTIRAFWHVQDGKDPVSSLIVDGSVAVPASVTAQPGNGCITFEGSDGTKTVTSADLRYRVSANSGTEDGTEPEPDTPAWQQLVDAVHTDATAAEQAKTDAQTAAQQSEASAKKSGQALSDTISAKEDALKAIGDKQTTATQAVDIARDKALQQVEASTEAAQTAASEATTSAGDADRSAQEAAGSLQELKDGIANGNFKGEPGNDGKSPVVTVTDIENGYRVSITDKDGTKTIDVLNGKDGKDGTQIDDATVGLDAWSSKHIVDMLCPPLDETGNPVVCYPVAGYPLGCKVSWEPTQEGTGDPSPDNIRPIHGRDSVTVERCGENLLNIAPFTKLTEQGITYEYVANGGIHISGTALTSVTSPMFSVWYLPPGKYYGADSGEGIGTSIVVHRNGRNVWLSAKGTFAILAGDVIKFWCLSVNSGKTVDKTLYPYIVPGTTAPTTYTPYTGQTATLTLPHTIYGGTVDVVRGSGEKAWNEIALIDTYGWYASTNQYRTFYCVNIKNITRTTVENGGYAKNWKCTHFKSEAYSYAQSGDRDNTVSFQSDKETLVITFPGSIDELKSYLAAQYAAGTPVQIAYKLAEPVPFTATGAQPISALSGANTVITDADSVTVTGRADPIKRIIDLEDAVASMTTT
ncbi:MAG: hypothetical protein ACLS9X_07225 [Faecalibacterium sp.]